MRNEGVDVALRVGNVAQCKPDDAGPMAVLDLVFEDRTARRPADFAPLVILDPFYRLVGQRDEMLLQMRETGAAERTAQRGDEMVVLSIVVGEQRLIGAVRQLHCVTTRGLGQASEILCASVENPDDRSATVVAAREHRSGETREAPHEIERFFRIGGFDVIDDCASLRFQVVDERAALLPIDEGAGPGNRSEALANFSCGVGRTASAGERKP
nr:hypothetical protein [Methylosinus sp. H3A]